MEQERTNKPEPLHASATLHGGLVGSLSATASLRPVPKPPWQRFIDRNVNAAKAVLKAFWRVGQSGSAENPFGTSRLQAAVRQV